MSLSMELVLLTYKPVMIVEPRKPERRWESFLPQQRKIRALRVNAAISRTDTPRPQIFPPIFLLLLCVSLLQSGSERQRRWWTGNSLLQPLLPRRCNSTAIRRLLPILPAIAPSLIVFFIITISSSTITTIANLKIETAFSRVLTSSRERASSAEKAFVRERAFFLPKRRLSLIKRMEALLTTIVIIITSFNIISKIIYLLVPRISWNLQKSIKAFVNVDLPICAFLLLLLILQKSVEEEFPLADLQNLLLVNFQRLKVLQHIMYQKMLTFQELLKLRILVWHHHPPMCNLPQMLNSFLQPIHRYFSCNFVFYIDPSIVNWL